MDGEVLIDQTTAYRLALHVQYWHMAKLRTLATQGLLPTPELKFVLLAPGGSKADTDDREYIRLRISSMVAPVLAGLDASGGQGASGWWQKAVLTMLLAVSSSSSDGASVLTEIRRLLASASAGLAEEQDGEARRLALALTAAELLTKWRNIEPMWSRG